VVQEVQVVHPIAQEAAAEVIQEVHPHQEVHLHQEVLHVHQVAPPVQVEGDKSVVETGHALSLQSI